MTEIQDLIASAWESRRAGRYGEAEGVLRQAVALARRLGPPTDQARALSALAQVLRDAGSDDAALPMYEEALELSRQADDRLLTAHTGRHLGDLHREAGRLPATDACYQEALSLYEAADDPNPVDVANALRPAALLKEAEGDPDGARRLWTEARRLYAAAGVEDGVEECDRHLS